MLEQNILNRISDTFTGDIQKSILDFMEFLDANRLSFEKGTGYWQDKFYLLAKYKNEVIYYILLNGNEDNSEPKGLTIWSGEDSSNHYATLYPNEEIKEAIWEHIDICGNCGGCNNPGGTTKMIFGKEFDNVCITPMRFDNPNVKALGYLKELLSLWKTSIIGNLNDAV